MFGYKEMAMQVAKELKDHYNLAKEYGHGQLPDSAHSLNELWTQLVSTSLRKLNLPDYVAFCEEQGLPREWLGKDGSVERMNLDGVLDLAHKIQALGSATRKVLQKLRGMRLLDENEKETQYSVFELV